MAQNDPKASDLAALKALFEPIFENSPAPVEMLVYTPEEFRGMASQGNGFIMKAIEEVLA
jgi:hypothetical protein